METPGLARLVTVSLEAADKRMHKRIDNLMRKEIDCLLGSLLLLRKVIQDRPDGDQGDVTNHNWSMKLRDVLMDAEDLCDELAVDEAIRSMEGNDDGSGCMFTCSRRILTYKGWRKIVTEAVCCSFLKRTNLRHSRKKFQTINARIAALVVESSKFEVRVLSQSTDTRFNWRQIQSSEVLQEQEPMFGRTEVKDAVVARLLEVPDIAKSPEAPSLNDSSKRNILVLPIVGMGGIGKTALVKLIFNDDNINQYFDIRVWVYVGFNNDVRRATKIILDCICRTEGKEHNYTSLAVMQVELSKLLNCRHLLLVLDDVWVEDERFFEQLLMPLKNTYNGRVVITSRIASIGRTIEGCLPAVFLQGLDDESMWEILQQNAFGDGKKIPTEPFELIGKQIVASLRGSPLAAKAVGGILGHEKTVKHWMNVLNGFQTSTLREDGILSALMLSYQHLSAELKPCLVYFSLYPNGFVFKESEIIHFWMAHHLLHAEGSKSVEYIGKKYLRALENSSFIQNVDGMYSMHDLITDLVKTVFKDVCLRLPKNHGHPQRVFHISVHGTKDIPSLMKMPDYIFHKLRTLIIYPSSMSTEIEEDIQSIDIGSILENMKCLRVLVLKGNLIRALPLCVCNLKLLRYLDVSYSCIDMLPEELGDLQNLQILNLASCRSLRGFPRTITRLVNLRHLVADFKELSPLQEIGRLSMLQSLNLFTVCKENGCGICELKNLNMLGGSLKIENLEIITNAEQAKEAQLVRKEFLEGLELTWRSREIDDMESANQLSDVEEQVLEALQPCTNLKQFCISGYSGSKLPDWLNHLSLSLLETLELIGCSKLKSLPCHLGKMPFLKHLKVCNMSSMVKISWGTISMDDDERCSYSSLVDVGSDILFPLLESLHFCNMPEWVEWQVEQTAPVASVVGTFFIVPHLCMTNCPKLENIDFFLNIKSLKISICTRQQHLEVRNCVEIMRKYQQSYDMDNDINPYWQDISHIPKVSFY